MATYSNLVDLTRLTKFKELVKTYVDTEDAKSIKNVNYDATSRKITFYKVDPVTEASTAVKEITLPAEYDDSAVRGLISTLNGTVTEDGSVLKMIKDNAATATYKAASGDNAEVTLKGAIDDLYTQIGSEGGVADQIKTAIEDLDAEKEQTAGTDGLALKVTEVDGKITAISGSIAAETYDAYGAASDVQGDTTETVASVDAKVEALGTASAANVATVAMGTTDETTTALPTVGQVEAYVTNKVADLEGAMHFAGVISRNEGETDAEAIARVMTAPESGDVIVMADNSKEYIFVDPDPETDGDEAWREIGDEGLYVQKSTTIAGVDLENNITKDEMLTALNVADGAQVNVIETVKVNGTTLTATDKAVDVLVATGSANGTIAVNNVDVAVKGLASAAYTESTAYATADQGTKADSALQPDDITIVSEADIIALFNN